MAKGNHHGFREGTTHITTGDRIKPGDHHRKKSRCKYYEKGLCKHLNERCNGSSHCGDYDDGIAIINILEHSSYEGLKEDVQNFVNELQFSIPLNTPEGSKINKYIIKKCGLSEGDIERLEMQKIKCARLQHESDKRIAQYNQSLGWKCIIASIFIVTIPFCITYYLNNKRDSVIEAEKIKEKTIDKELIRKVEKYTQERKKYTTNEVKKCCLNTDTRNQLLKKAATLFNRGEYGESMFYAMKSIKEYNTKAILWLAEKFYKGIFFDKNEWYALILILYASYLGDMQAKELFPKIIHE